MTKVNDQELMVAVLSGESQRSIAERYGVTESTISKRVHKPAFRNELSEYRSAMIDETLTELNMYAKRAVDTLGELLESENDFARLQAAMKILDYLQSYNYQNDLLKQIREMKELQEAQADAIVIK